MAGIIGSQLQHSSDDSEEEEEAYHSSLRQNAGNTTGSAEEQASVTDDAASTKANIQRDLLEEHAGEAHEVSTEDPSVLSRMTSLLIMVMLRIWLKRERRLRQRKAVHPRLLMSSKTTLKRKAAVSSIKGVCNPNTKMLPMRWAVEKNLCFRKCRKELETVLQPPMKRD